MRGRSKGRLAVVLLLVGAMASFTLGAAAAQESSSSPAKKKVVFTVGLTNNIVTVNPLRAIETPEYEILAMEYNLLLGFDQKTLGPIPELATEVPSQENGGLSSDGLTWTFHIRSGVKWSDGQPLTAKDIAFTYNFILDNHFTNLTNYLPYTDSITAPDDTTLVWKTTKPTTAPLYPAWIYILPEHIWGSLNRDQARQYLNFDPTKGEPVVSGPYQMTQWNKGNFWVLDRNPNYWGPRPTVDEVVFKLFGNDETMVQGLKQGSIDFAEDVPVDLFDALNGVAGVAQNVGAAASFIQMSFNMCNASDPSAAPYCKKHPGSGNTALRDPMVRKAIAMAINKQALVDRVRRGYGVAGSSVVFPLNTYFHWDPGNETIPWNIQGANQLLDQAGYKMGPNGTRIDPKTGKPLIFRFIVRTENGETVTAGKLISGWLKQIGIQTQTTAVTDAKLIDAWTSNDYDMYIWGWGPDPDPDFILSTFTSGQCGVWSDTCFSDPQYNSLYEQQRIASSRSQRQQIIYKMEQIVYRQVPEIVLWYENDLQAYRSDRWTGFTKQPCVGDPSACQGSILFQYGDFEWNSLSPVGAGGTSTTGGGLSAGVWIAVVAGFALIGAAVTMIRRRGEADEDRA